MGTPQPSSRARLSLRIVEVVLAVVVVVPVPTTMASYAARTANGASRFAFTALYPASGLVASPAGHDVTLSWTAGQNGSGYAVNGAANGSSSDCSASTFTPVATTSATTYSDTGRYQPQGTWFCYQVKTAYAPWTSVQNNPTVAAQIGFVTTSVTATNGGVGGTLGPGDTVVITFNQPVNTATGPSGTNSVCITNNAPVTVVLGGTATGGSCNATEANNLGTLTGGTGGAAPRNGRYSATWAWTNGNQRLTITLGAVTAGSASTIAGTWTFKPTTTATKLLSATGGFHICDTNTGGGACLPTVSGSF